ncbi:hypothetical protein KI387_034787, partial [Taxus chinensis]
VQHNDCPNKQIKVQIDVVHAGETHIKHEEVSIEEIKDVINGHKSPDEAEVCHAHHEEDVVTEEFEEVTTAAEDNEEHSGK